MQIEVLGTVRAWRRISSAVGRLGMRRISAAWDRRTAAAVTPVCVLSRIRATRCPGVCGVSRQSGIDYRSIILFRPDRPRVRSRPFSAVHCRSKFGPLGHSR